jgi:hypothetical protein
MGKDHYREDVEELIEEQLREKERKKTMIRMGEQMMKDAHPGADQGPKPPCWFDGKLCPTPGKGCESVYSSVDGKEETVWRCPRFHE